MHYVVRGKKRRDGKRSPYRGRYCVIPGEKLRDVPLHTTDKQIAIQRLNRIVQDEQREREGLIAPKHQREAAQRSLLDHVEEYIADRLSVGRDERYVRELRQKLLRLIAECAWQFVGQVNAESFCKWRAKQKKAPKTLNEYLNAICGLMNWLEPRIGQSPLRFVEKVQTNEAPRRERRAFTVNERQRLIDISGQRGVVYRIASETGIRRGELNEIEWRDVHLDTAVPFITVRASIAKNHKHAMQPLTPDAVEALRKLRPTSAQPNERVFAGLIPRMEQFRSDLRAARITYVDAKGEYADFHSLRKTFGTMLTLAGVGQRTVMELMRHSDMRLTAKTYTDANMLPVSDAVARLLQFAGGKQGSHIGSQELVSESLDVSASVSPNVGEPKLLRAADQLLSLSKSAFVTQSSEVEKIGPARIRTWDQGIMSPLL
jgi:integrase